MEIPVLFSGMKLQIIVIVNGFALTGASLRATAGTFNWTGATDGSWSVATNWDAGVPASATDTAVVFDNTNQPNTVNNIGGGLTLNSLTLGPNSGVRSFTGNALVFDGVSPSITLQNTTGSGNTVLDLPIQINQTLSITGGVDFDRQLIFGNAASFNGPGGVTWAGGVGIINSTNNYSGPTTIAAGAISVNKSGAFGNSPSVTIQVGAALQLNGGSTPTINRPLFVAGDGVFGFPALHASSGWSLWAGPFSLTANGRIGALAGASLTLNGTISLDVHDLTVDSAAAGLVVLGDVLSGQTSSTTNGLISGTGGITKTGPGTLRIGGFTTVSNTYSGPTLISGGAVVAAKGSAFGNTSSITAAPGTVLMLDRGIRQVSFGQPDYRDTSIERPLNLGALLVALGPVISAHRWNGPISLTDDAELSADEDGRLGVGSIALNGHTLTVRPQPAAGQKNRVVLAGAITGSGALVLDASTNPGATDTISLQTAGSTFAGPVFVQNNVILGPGDGFGDPANTVTFSGTSNIVTFNGVGTVAPRPWVLGGDSGLQIIPGNFSSTIHANISGTGPLFIAGIGLGTGGIITLSGDNTFTGGLVIGADSTVVFSADANLGAAGQPVTLHGGLYVSTTTVWDASRPLVLAGNTPTLGAPQGVTFTVNNDLSGPGKLVLAGSAGGQFGGTIRLGGTNSHAGGTEIAGATLETASDASLGGPAGVLNIGRPNGAFVLAGRLLAAGDLDIAPTRTTSFRSATIDTNGHQVAFNQPISGLGLTKDGAGVLRLNTANTDMSGVNDVTITAGSIELGVDEALGRPRITLAGGTLDLNGHHQTASGLWGPGAVLLGSGGTLTLIGGSTIEATISGTGHLVFGQSGFIADSYRLLADNPFTGSVSVVAGNRVSVRSTQGFGAAGNSLLLDDGGIESDSTAAEPVVIGASFPMTIGAGGAGFGANGAPLVVEAQLAGSSPIRVRGGGDGYEVRFAHPANTFVSDIQLGDPTFGSAVLGLVADGSLGDAGNAITLGYRSFDGEVTRTGTGTLRAFADVTLPPGRVIRIAGGDHWEDRGGVLDTNGFTVTVAGAIAEVDSQTPLKKAGAGTLRLDGANTYTGETTVAQGTLGGAGTIAAVRVEPGATLSPGASAGTLRTGDVTWEAGAGLELDFASPASADRLAVAGQVTLNGDVPLSLRLGFTPTVEQTFVVIDNDGADPVQTGGLFIIGENTLDEGETFSAAGATWTIHYAGGDGNDVTLTVAAAAGAPADFDGDGDVDLADFSAFQACFNGPNRPYAQAGCGVADFDADNDVDLLDFQALQACFNGPNRRPTCL